MLSAVHLAAVEASTHLAAAGDIAIDPNGTVNRFRVVLIAALGVVLIGVSLAAVAGPGRKGNTRKSVDIGVSTLVCLIPGVLGFLGVALAFGAAFLGYVIPGVTG